MFSTLVGCGSADISTIPAEDPTPASVAPTEPAEEPVAQPTDMLPAPLYMLSNASGSRQIWRIETDGQTTNQISNESAGIENFDISPTTGELVYVVGQHVIKVSPDGKERTVLFEGPEDSNSYNDLRYPIWSPNGQEIMVAYGGLAVLPASGGEPEVLIPNRKETDPALVELIPIAGIFIPIAWSPDGQRMLITEWLMPDNEPLMRVVDRNTLEQVDLTSHKLSLCCGTVWSAVWSIDGESILFCRSRFGLDSPGLWRANISTGEVTSYGPSDDTNGPWLKATDTFEMPDGSIRAFTKLTAINEIQNPEAASMDLQMATVAPDGIITALREDSFPIGEAVWFPDGSAAVVSEQFDDNKTFIVLPGEAPMILLPLTGDTMNWGH